MRHLIAILLTLGLLPGLASATEPEMRTIAVTGVGEVFATPDLATLTLGVTHEDDEAAQAMAEASEGASAVLAQLAKAGIADRDVQTSTISLSPVWSHDRNGDKPPEIDGFRATLSVTVRVRVLDSLGQVLDDVVSDGANQLGGIRFGFQEPDPLMDAARVAAVADGQAKAALYAQAAGVTLGPLHRLEDQGGTPRPEGLAMSAARDASVPIAPGEVSLSARVYMVYTIGE